ncbi:MAG TPA: hypothetical protein VNZ52_04960 [Candidatus Thermoplasmatota archaeon]|nr:hypothetical protein [Candidatus Thermoplasmatota archaeon]
MVALVLILQAFGDIQALTGSLNTAAGIALYLALWGLTGWTTYRAAADVGRVEPGFPRFGAAFLGNAIRWGGLNGFLFLTMLLVVTAIGFRIPQILLALPVAALPALIVGGLLGAAFAVIDGLLLHAAHRVVPGEGAPPGNP